MEKSESIKNIATALCAFQGEVNTIQKTAINPFLNLSTLIYRTY